MIDGEITPSRVRWNRTPGVRGAGAVVCGHAVSAARGNAMQIIMLRTENARLCLDTSVHKPLWHSHLCSARY